jgi:hypothetical protein
VGEITKRFLEGIGNVIGAIFKLVFQLERLLGFVIVFFFVVMLALGVVLKLLGIY